MTSLLGWFKKNTQRSSLTPVHQSLPVQNFFGIRAGSILELNVLSGDFHVTAEAPQAMLDALVAEVKDGVLCLFVKHHVPLQGRCKITIHMPLVNYLEGYDVCKINASFINKNIAVHAHGNSRIKLTGAASEGRFRADDASTIESTNCPVIDGDFTCTGVAKINAYVLVKANAMAQDAANITIKGSPLEKRLTTRGVARIRN